MAGLDVICIGAVNYDYMFRCTAEDLITDESEGAEDLSNSTELVERDIRELIRKDREYTTQLGGSAFITLKVIKYIFMHMKTAYVGVCGGLSDFELRFGKTNDLETELEHLDNREWFFTTENRFDRPENRYVAKSVVRLYNHSRNCIRIAKGIARNYQGNDVIERLETIRQVLLRVQPISKNIVDSKCYWRMRLLCTSAYEFKLIMRISHPCRGERNHKNIL